MTYNLGDFPVELLEPFGVEAQHPDEFLVHLFSLAPAQCRRAAESVRLRLRRPAVDIATYHDILKLHHLHATVARLRGPE